MSKSHNPGRIRPIIQVVAGILRDDPTLYADYERLIAVVEEEITELQDKSTCANCDASMSQYEYNVNIIDVALIIGMARAVRDATMSGVAFTEANKVHVPTLPVSDAVRHRTSKCAKLGLIAKCLNAKGKHIGGTWVITKRGFAAMRGERIPTGIIVWRGRTIERADETVTFEEVRADYKTKVEKYYVKHGKARDDEYGDEVMGYSRDEWVEFAGVHDGRLF